MYSTVPNEQKSGFYYIFFIDIFLVEIVVVYPTYDASSLIFFPCSILPMKVLY